MSQVKVGKQRLAIAGETTSVSKVNTLFTDITSASTAIGESNTRTESISRRHLKDLYETPQGVHPTFHQLQSRHFLRLSTKSSLAPGTDFLHQLCDASKIED